MKASDRHKKNFILAALVVLPGFIFAKTATDSASGSVFSNPLFITLLVIIIILAIMTLALSNVLRNVIGSDFFIEKLKKEKSEKNNQAAKTIAVLFFLLMGLSGYSREIGEATVQSDPGIGGLNKLTFYVMIITIFAELIILGILFNTFKKILGTKTKALAEPVKVKTKTLLDKINATVEIENEESILLDHDYDGIKELDNDLPPWWKYGFYLTVLVAVIYMVNYHITKTSPLQAEEYHNSLKKAEKDIAEYMKTSANNVDETTVKLLTDASDIKVGKDLFIATCAACHGQSGEGTVGPNLADDYWLHGGSIQDVFKTIKYGWPDKGMKSWKDDFSPMQIAQLTSFLRSFKGTNPSKPKEKQGELYIEKNNTIDSIAVKSDSTKVMNAALVQ